MLGRILSAFGLGSRSLLSVFALTVLFWNVYDSAMTYLTPLVIESQGYSKTAIGLIIGSSSITGMVFDFMACRIFKNTHFRRMFLALFTLCALYPLLLWQANSLWLILVLMAVWGIYFDLYNFGVFDFVGRYTNEESHVSAFGVAHIMRQLSSVVAPLAMGFLVYAEVTWPAFAFAWLFLAIGALFLSSLYGMLRKVKPNVVATESVGGMPWQRQVNAWKSLSRRMAAPLILTVALFTVEGFFWTMGPLFGEEPEMAGLGGVLMTAYSLPALIVGWHVGKISAKHGKKRTAMVAFLLGAISLSTFALVHGAAAHIAVAFVSALFFATALPAINGAYADYIAEAPNVESHIQGIEDSAFNAGFIIGPVISGFVADLYGIAWALSALGFFCIALAIVLLMFTPKVIFVPNKLTV